MRKKNKSMVLQKTKFVRREEKRRNMHGSKKNMQDILIVI